jgi:hypothetical protein
MAEETSRMKIPYPSQGQANYYEVFKSGMDAIDADVFALWSKINAIFHGGGAITWSLNGSDYEFTYGDAIVCQIPSSGTAQSIAPTTIVIPPSHFGILDAAFGATSAGSLFGSVATQVSVDPSSSAFCWHNPTTHELVFSTGLVIALGGTATGIQPQGGGGGGSITVTDGTTTVTPATTLTFTDGAAVVTDAGGGNAEVQIQLTTKFVVSADGSTFYSSIQSAIDDAYSEYGTSGKDQVVFVRSGTYTETLVLHDGVALVAEASPQALDAKADAPFAQNRALPTAVIVDGEGHNFDPIGGQIRCTVRGIVFSSMGSAAAMFDLADTSAAARNKVSFVDCFFFSTSSGAIWEQSNNNTPNVEVSFYGCKFRWDGGTGGYEPMFYFGSDGGDQDYLFTDCDFFAKYTGRMVFRSNGGTGAGEIKITRCKFDKVDIDSGASFGSPLVADLSLTDVVMQQPERYCIQWNNVGTIYTYGCCTLEADFGYTAVNSSGPIIYSALFTIPWQASQSFLNVNSNVPSVANYVMPYRAVEGTPYLETAVGFTLDLEALYLAGSTITSVSWDTSIFGAGVRTVDLHNAAYTQGMYVTVWDSGGSGGSRNISVTSINSNGGMRGPHTSIVHNNGSLTFVATVDQNNDACWRSVSYFH